MFIRLAVATALLTVPLASAPAEAHHLCVTVEASGPFVTTNNQACRTVTGGHVCIGRDVDRPPWAVHVQVCVPVAIIPPR